MKREIKLTTLTILIMSLGFWGLVNVTQKQESKQISSPSNQQNIVAKNNYGVDAEAKQISNPSSQQNVVATTANNYGLDAEAKQIPNLSNQWSTIAQSNNGAVSYDIDTGTFSKKGSVVSYWTRVVLPISVDSLNGSSIVASYESINCNTRMGQIHVSHGLDKSGQILKTIGQQPASMIEADSWNYSIYNLVCSEHPALALQRQQAELTRIHLENLQRRAEITAETLNDAARIGASIMDP